MNTLEFSAILFIVAIIGFMLGFTVCNKSYNEPSEPTKVCRDGTLYEVTTEGNITIYDRKDFMTCEEAK